MIERKRLEWSERIKSPIEQKLNNLRAINKILAQYLIEIDKQVCQGTLLRNF